jgi:hypothetical protein
MLVCAFSHNFAHETAGAARTRHSPLPLLRGGKFKQGSGKPCRENAEPRPSAGFEDRHGPPPQGTQPRPPRANSPRFDMLAGDAGPGFGRAPHATPLRLSRWRLSPRPMRGYGTGSHSLPEDLGQSMIRKSGDRLSENIMLKQESMIRKSGTRFSEKIMLKREILR